MNMSIQVRYRDWGDGSHKQITHLILNEKLYSLNGSGSSLRDPGSNSGEHKVLNESQLLARHLGGLIVAR